LLARVLATSRPAARSFTGLFEGFRVMVTIPSTQVCQHVRIGQCVTPASDGRQQQEVAAEDFARPVDFIDDGLGVAVMPNHALHNASFMPTPVGAGRKFNGFSPARHGSVFVRIHFFTSLSSGSRSTASLSATPPHCQRNKSRQHVASSAMISSGVRASLVS
jgi:hypothetical protein